MQKWEHKWINAYAAYKPVHPCDFLSVFLQEQKYTQVAMLTTQNQVKLYNNNNNRRSRDATGLQTNWFLRGDYFINSPPHHKVMSKQQNKHWQIKQRLIVLTAWPHLSTTELIHT